jgi:hypothetical protein
MYVDEVGNSDLKSSANPNHRYLSLTGVIFELDHILDVVHPSLEQLKRDFFRSHPDDPVVLHRKELVNSKFPVDSLRDPNVMAGFNSRLLSILNGCDYTVITAVIDKHEFNQQYVVWKDDPYRYCLEVLVERYVRWLEREESFGDVMAESRGGAEDRRLKASFLRVWRDGTSYVGHERFEKRIISQELKVKPKNTNVAGLQIADLIAHPSFTATKCRQQNTALPDNFGGTIAQILEESKYDRSWNGRINGWGRKWLP